MTSLKVYPGPLNGRIFSQPSKSMAHRAMICAALADGTSFIDNVVLSDDISATLGAISAIGADTKVRDSTVYKGRKSVTIESRGQINLRAKEIDCGESGSTARFILPITRLSAEPVTVTGHGSLISRPFTPYKEVFSKKGVYYSDSEEKMPITVSGKLSPGEYVLPGDVSSQFISGLLLALPLLESSSHLTIQSRMESSPYIFMTIRVLKEFGIHIRSDAEKQSFDIAGGQKYKPVKNYVVEGDWSQAAFFCVMGALSGNIVIEGLKTDSIQGDKVILDILEHMGARFEFRKEGLSIKKSRLSGTDADASQCPDLVPAIAAAASVAQGMTHVRNAARLRIKESDRLGTISRELGALGADITEEAGGLIIHGVPSLLGGRADGSRDHRIVMALAAASTVCKNAVVIKGSETVKKSYPGFWEDFKVLGGRIEEL